MEETLNIFEIMPLWVKWFAVSFCIMMIIRYGLALYFTIQNKRNMDKFVRLLKEEIPDEQP